MKWFLEMKEISSENVKEKLNGMSTWARESFSRIYNNNSAKGEVCSAESKVGKKNAGNKGTA